MTVHQPDCDVRRAYWTEQMELGDAFVQRLINYEVRECGEKLASIIDAAAAENVEMFFSTSKIVGDFDRVYFLRERLVEDVIAVGRAMNRRGWILKVEDGFRTLEMQRQLARKPNVFDVILERIIWENSGTIPSEAEVFRRATVLCANIPKIGTHMSASAIDISVFSRDDGREIWRGKPYLEMSELTPMRSPFIGPQDLQNRLEITAMMESRGLMHYPFEFWHYSKGDAMARLLSNDPSPACYGAVDWNPATNEVTIVNDSLVPLNSLEMIKKEIASAMHRSNIKPHSRAHEAEASAMTTWN